jgi:hypothetical protein
MAVKSTFAFFFSSYFTTFSPPLSVFNSAIVVYFFLIKIFTSQTSNKTKTVDFLIWQISITFLIAGYSS